MERIKSVRDESPVPDWLRESLFLGEPFDWYRGNPVKQGDNIVLPYSGAGTYKLHSEPDLLFDLAGIETEEQILRFVRKWGLIWHGPGAEIYIESIQKICGAASYLRMIVTAYGLLRDTFYNVEAIDKLMIFYDSIIEPLLPKNKIIKITSDKELKKQTTIFITNHLNLQLNRVRIGIISDVDLNEEPLCNFYPAIQSKDLLAYSFSILSNIILQNMLIKKCEAKDCHEFFLVGTPNAKATKKYCSDSCQNRTKQFNYYNRVERKKVQN